MRTQLTLLAVAAFILIVPCCTACRGKQVTTFTAEQSHASVEAWQIQSWLAALNLSVLDSCVTITSRDTTRTVRRVSATARRTDSLASASFALRADTAAAVTQNNEVTPAQAKSKKNGVAGLRFLQILGLCIIFFVLGVLFVVFVKFYLYLRLK